MNSSSKVNLHNRLPVSNEYFETTWYFSSLKMIFCLILTLYHNLACFVKLANHFCSSSFVSIKFCPLMFLHIGKHRFLQLGKPNQNWKLNWNIEYQILKGEKSNTGYRKFISGNIKYRILKKKQEQGITKNPLWRINWVFYISSNYGHFLQDILFVCWRCKV